MGAFVHFPVASYDRCSHAHHRLAGEAGPNGETYDSIRVPAYMEPYWLMRSIYGWAADPYSGVSTEPRRR